MLTFEQPQEIPELQDTVPGTKEPEIRIRDIEAGLEEIRRQEEEERGHEGRYEKSKHPPLN